MQIFFFLICTLPFMLVFLIIYLIYIIAINKQKLNKYSIFTISFILVITIILVGYYFPNNNILKDFNRDDISIYLRVDSQNIEIKDKDKINKLVEAINRHTYIKSAAKSLEMQTFSSENLILIDIFDTKNGRLTHVYVLSNFGENDSQDLDDLSKGDLLQINEQMYNVKDSKGLSTDIYNLLKGFGFFA